MVNIYCTRYWTAKRRIAVGVGINAGTKLGRADLAHFMLTLVEEPRFSEQMPFVSY